MNDVIGIVVFPEVQLLDVAGPLDVFNEIEGIDVQLIGVTTHAVSPVGLKNVRFFPDATLIDALPDVLLVPGGDGISHLLEDDVALKDIAALGERARFVTSVCTGALVLGAAGLLSGYKASTHWRYLELLRLVGATPCDDRVVRDRDRITSGGVTAGIDFGLTLLAELKGDDVAKRRQLMMQYDPHPPFAAGEPRGAPFHIVEELSEQTRANYERRAALLTKAVAKLQQ